MTDTGLKEISLDELKAELRRGARVALMLRHAERPKMDQNDPSFGDALPLTYEGEETARYLGELLSEFAFDTQFHSSPLTRTRMTARRIADGMGLRGVEIPTEERLGNGSFYYADAHEVLEIFKHDNFFPASLEYFRTGRQRGFRELYGATDEFERWLDATWRRRLFVITTHDLYIAAFLQARGVGTFTRENWTRFLDGGAVIVTPDGRRRYVFVRTGLSQGVVGVRKPQIKGVVFDFGGVMTTSVMPERVRNSVAELGIGWAELERGFRRYRRLMDGGFISMADMYGLIWADAGRDLPPAVSARLVEEDLASFLDEYVNRRTLRWMRELKAAGLRLAILTNMSTELEARFRKTFAEFVELADAVVVSGRERMFKPQRRIFDLTAARLGLKGEELCFIDDSAENCDGARRARWHAVRFTGNDEAERAFAALSSPGAP